MRYNNLARFGFTEPRVPFVTDPDRAYILPTNL